MKENHSYIRVDDDNEVQHYYTTGEILATGQYIQEENFLQRKKIGLWRFYDIEGRLVAEEIYIL